MVTHSEIQHPRLKGEKVFQSFCLKLVRRQWNDPYAIEYGRRGQGQQGADITGSDHRGGFVNAAVQCKGSETHDPRNLSETELEEEVAKAKGFSPPLDLLIIAYSGPRDANLQRKTRELDADNRKAGLFKVVLWSWDDIVEYASNFAEVMQDLLVQNNVARPDLDPKRPRQDKTAAALESLVGMAGSLSAIQAALVSNDISSGANDDPISHAKIDVLRDQIQAGNGSITIEPLKTFIQNMDAETSPRVRFRAYANLGAAQTQCGDFASAAISFDEASEAEPNTAEGFAFAARAALLRGQEAIAYSAAEKALGLDGKQKLAAAILLDTAPPEHSARDLEARVSSTADEFDVGWALARRYAESGDHANSLRVAREIAVKPENWARGTAIADAILHQFESNQRMRLGASIPAEERLLLEEAQSLLESAWAQIKKRSDRSNWAHVAANLSGVYRMLGRDLEADALAVEAYELQPTNRQLKTRAALAYIHRDNFGAAMALAASLAGDGNAEDQLFAAHVHASARQWNAIAPFAQKAFDELKEDEAKARAAELLVLAEHRTMDAPSALAKAVELRPKFAPSVAFEARCAELARRVGDEGQIAYAAQALDAFDLAKLTALEQFELADAYADSGEWSKSADLLADLHTNDRPSESLRRRLFALYRADKRTEARGVFESLEGDALKSKEILRLGAAIYERSGMLPKALALLTNAISLDTNDLRSRLDWARLSIRNGDEQPLQKWLKNTSLQFAAAPEDLMELAQLLDRAGRRRDALQLGYETLRKHWGKSERLHMMFMSLFLLKGTKAETWLKPKVVAEDTVVFLADDRGAPSHFRIETTTETSADVRSPTHPFAKLLLGSKVGDTVASEEGIGQHTNYTVKEIKHKYIDLLHQAMGAHNTLFPGSRALGTYHIEPDKEDALEPIFEQARERARVGEDATQLYDDSVVTVDVVAKVLGIDSIDASLGLRFRTNARFDSCLGSEEERSAAIDRLAGVDTIMAEAITLAHWQEIGLLADLEAVDDLQIEVVQGTIDLLMMRADEAKRAITQGGGSLVARGEKLAIIESTVAERKQTAKLWADLLTWTREHTTIVPTESVTGVSEEDVSRVLSDASIDTIATASFNKKILVCDDRRLRAVAQSLGAPQGAWTQPLLIALHRAGKVSSERYVELIAKLQERRIGFVSVGPSDLTTALLSDQALVLETLIDALTRPTVVPQSMLGVIQDFLSALWLDPQFLPNREGTTGMVFRGIVSNRPDDRFKLMRITITEFNAILKALPFPMDFMSRAWEKYVVGFLQGHFLTDMIATAR